MQVTFAQRLYAQIDPKLTELSEIWQYVGYDVDQCSAKLNQAGLRLGDCLQEIIREANADRNEQERQVEILRREVADLAHDLQLPAFFPDRGLVLCQLIATMQSKKQAWLKLSEQRARELVEWKTAICNLADLLDKPREDTEQRLASILQNRTVPSEKMLEELTELRRKLKEEYEPLLMKFRNLCMDLDRLVEEGDYHSVLSDEERLILVDYRELSESKADAFLPKVNATRLQVLENWRSRMVKEKARTMGLTDELRPAIETLWQRLAVPEAAQEDIRQQTQRYCVTSLKILETEMARLETLKQQNLAQYVDSLRDEMQQMATLCFVDQVDRIDSPVTASLGEVTALEDQLEQMKLNYDKHKSMYESVHHYKRLWDELYMIEQRMKDPAILLNRGGILLKTEKEKNRIQRDLQKYEISLQAQMDEYNRTNGNESFKFQDGSNFQDYVTRKQAEYEAFKTSNKTSRRTSSANKLGAQT